MSSFVHRISHLLPLRATTSVAAFTLATLAGLGVASADAWKDKGGECDKGAFKTPADAEIGDIAECTKLWEAYRSDVSGVKGDYKKKVVSAMTRLYSEGNDKEAKLAKGALERLGVEDLPKRQASKPATPKEPARKTFAPGPADKGQIKAAEAQFKAGIGAYKKKDYDKALAAYTKMTEVAPGYAKGHYNVACVNALKGDEKGMANALMNLRDLSAAGDKDATEMLNMTKKDTDFDGVRDTSIEYKRITGFIKVLVINDLGEKGEENVENLMGSLEKLGYNADSKDSDKKPLKKPHIFYAEHARTQAYIIKQVIDHPKTVTKEMAFADLKGFDVVVQWSDDVKGEPKTYVQDPEEAEKKLDSLAKKEDELLAKPNDAVDELDEALGKPGEVQDKIGEQLDRPGDAVDKVDKTLDKLKSPFK